jgi:hypothetical protein
MQSGPVNLNAAWGWQAPQHSVNPGFTVLMCNKKGKFMRYIFIKCSGDWLWFDKILAKSDM